MISLTDSQLRFLLDLTEPLLPADQTAFLQALVERLRHHPEIGDRAVQSGARTDAALLLSQAQGRGTARVQVRDLMLGPTLHSANLMAETKYGKIISSGVLTSQ